jgi:hypothetical protein
MIYVLVEQWHLQQKHIVVITYCSSYREDMQRHTHKGSYYSSHDLLQKHDSTRIYDWNPCHHNCIRVISLVQRGRYYLEESQRNLGKGAVPRRCSGRWNSPKESLGRGDIPKERNTIFH